MNIELINENNKLKQELKRYKEIVNLFKMAFITGDAEHKSINGRSIQALTLLEELENNKK